MKIIACILFFTFSVSAQNTNSAIHSTVDSINAILKANPLAHYTDINKNGAFIKKISANEQGIVAFTDSIPKLEITTPTHNKPKLIPDCCIDKTIRTLDLFAVKKWDVHFPFAYLKDKNNQTFGSFIGIRKEDLIKLKTRFDHLAILCRKEETGPTFSVKKQVRALTKQETIDYIKSYYAVFNTGSDQYSYDYGITKQGSGQEFRKFTGNYKVEIKDCKFKISFDSYKWPYQELKGTTVIEFDLSEIDSLKQGARELQILADTPADFVVINAAILFHFKNNKNATVLQKAEKDELLEKVEEINLKIHEYPDAGFSDNKIVMAFDKLRELCNTPD